MAGVVPQPRTASTSSRSSSVVNGNSNLDYINGHAGLPESPSANLAPVAPAPKKGKGKKAADPNETGKLLAAKINQLELDAAGEKDQEAEIEIIEKMRKHGLPKQAICDMVTVWSITDGNMISDQPGALNTLQMGLTSLDKHDLPTDVIATVIRAREMLEKSLAAPVSAQDKPDLSSTQATDEETHKLTTELVKHVEREVKKATRDLTSLLTGMETGLPRLEAVQKKYTELLSDMKKTDRELGKSKKRADQLQKEKDQGRSELSKTASMKEKLEKLCRELTRENKKMKEEHKKMEDSEKKSREALGEKIECILSDVNEIMEQKDNPASQKFSMETDELFAKKFKSLFDQYDLRELHFYSLMRTKECEVQYNLARYEQQRKIAESEANRSRTLSAQVSTFSQTETELRSQLNIYVEKFKQVEDTLNNSNDLFLTFRKEMEEMSKKTKRLEKENLNLTRKHDLTNRNILEMAEERTRVNKEMETLRKKNNTLESVIRRMQDQGRAPAAGTAIEGDEEGTESDYEEDEYDEEEGSEEGEYDDDTEEEALQAQAGSLPTFGPVPPPSTSAQAQVNGKANGEINGVLSS